MSGHGLRRRHTRPLLGGALAVLAAGALTATGLVGNAQAADVNVAKNAGFESGLTNWTCSAGSGTTVSSPVHGGTAALKATPAGQDNAQCTQTVAVKPGSTYTLSSWVQGGYAYLGASGTGTTDVSTWSPGSTGWTQLTTSFKTGPSTTSVTVYTHGWYGQAAYYADDISVNGPDGGGGTDPTPESEYFKTALGIKDILTVVNTQYYNSGSMLGCDGKVYSQGSVDFLTALACIQLEGGLDPSQVGLGVPASTSGAGSGYVAPSVVNAALDCLASGTNCGTFKPSKAYPGLRGAMTWSTNWDAKSGNSWSNAVAPHVHGLP
ncbi:carbohydrate binding domain-containing protein [Streptomyces sp. NBC_00846]|uniref:carbohydrate binding domain-containing protein n=1 Tax=Streptomyces sp. NBC_00846 TaxID=2975849 RepID=UPI00386A11AA